MTATGYDLYGPAVVTPPTCPVCKDLDQRPLPLVYREPRPNRANGRAFYGCRNYQNHPKRKVIIDAAQWAATHRKP
jgi:hypothetical protein